MMAVDENTAPLSLSVVTTRAGVMTRGLFNTEPTRAYCGDCRGKGFALKTPRCGRSARRCQRCRGKGFTTVGSTKR